MTKIVPNPPAEDGKGGTAVTRFNALTHGILSRYVVLPWENADEYHALLAALRDEHRPEGPTEDHLVEELAGIMWRKQRLRLAEAAAHRRALKDTFEPWSHTVESALVHLDARGKVERVVDAIGATSERTAEDIRALDEDEAMTRRALELLDTKRNDAYGAALDALREDTRDWWQDELTGDPEDVFGDEEERCTADAEGLRRFLEGKTLPWIATHRKELANRSLIREQAFGESCDPNRLERLGRYEVHLDRKLERTLAMLLRLRDLRPGVDA